MNLKLDLILDADLMGSAYVDYTLGWSLFYDHEHFFETPSQIMRLGKKIIHTKFEIDQTTR